MSKAKFDVPVFGWIVCFCLIGDMIVELLTDQVTGYLYWIQLAFVLMFGTGLVIGLYQEIRGK